MITLEKQAPTVTRFFRRMRGGSQAILANASDGLVYVVKFTNNLQGPNVLFNECVGNELYRLSGLPVAPWRLLRITKSFIDRNPGCWMETPNGKLRPDSGVCFGSQFLGGEEIEIFEIPVGEYYKRISNRNDFWLAWLLDECASHADNRQAIFRVHSDRSMDASFVDHGHMFGGPRGESHPRLGASRHLDSRVYCASCFAERVPERLSKVDSRLIWHHALALPTEWTTPSAISRLSACLNTIKSSLAVESLFEKLRDAHVRAELLKRDGFQFGRELPSSLRRVGLEVRGVDCVWEGF